MKKSYCRSSSSSSIRSQGDGDGHDEENVEDDEDEETLRDYDAFKKWLDQNGLSKSSPVNTPVASPAEPSSTSRPVAPTLCKVCRKKMCILYLIWVIFVYFGMVMSQSTNFFGYIDLCKLWNRLNIFSMHPAAQALVALRNCDERSLRRSWSCSRAKSQGPQIFSVEAIWVMPDYQSNNTRMNYTISSITICIIFIYRA